MMQAIRDSRVFAFLQGFFEHLDGCGGRTHPTNGDWNDAYDSGMNWADWLRGRGEG